MTDIFLKILSDIQREKDVKEFNKENGGVFDKDPRMMNNGCLNIYHHSYRENYMSVSEYNARLTSSQSNF